MMYKDFTEGRPVQRPIEPYEPKQGIYSPIVQTQNSGKVPSEFGHINLSRIDKPVPQNLDNYLSSFCENSFSALKNEK